MNVIKMLQSRISERLLETKNPCKSFKSEDNADYAGEAMAKDLGKIFDANEKPCRYVVVYIKELNRYTPAFDMTELLNRPNAHGGYVMHASNKGFYTY